ncbi:paraneoplastic antigen Ma1 homolog [Trichomycterus rosablanca]|uniref:paraneoplastic antigen Ma1 homolog n=1 Tax=Trichomycterus rosablanca TaxID=2290929 RepID=UPI002F3545DF
MYITQAVVESRKLNIPPDCALVLGKVPRGVSDDVILDVLDTVKVWGRTRIRGRWCSNTDHEVILVETKNVLEASLVPAMIGVEGEAGPWPVFLVNGLEGGELGGTSSTVRDPSREPEVPARVSEKTVAGEVVGPKMDLSLELVKAIGALMDRCEQGAADGPSYRKLRLFSGLRPVPPGEEDYEVWAEQANQMVSEWRCSEAAKKQRVAESLRGPASDIIRFLKVSEPSATVVDYLVALDTTYGSTESGAELMAKFRYTYQNKGEQLSQFAYRLEKLLHQALAKGGIAKKEMNGVRMEQITKGALIDDMVALRLRVTRSLREPPSFSELLREIREEEAWGQAWEKVKARVSTASAHALEKDVELDQLRNEVKGLSGQVSGLLKVAAIKSTSGESLGRTETRRQPGSNDVPVDRARSSTTPMEIFCYRCGEDGHLRRDCRGEEDLRKVTKKLIARQQGNFLGAL